MCSCEGRLQAIVLYDGAASLRVTHRPHLGHAQCVTAVLSTDVLKMKHHRHHQADSLIQTFDTFKDHIKLQSFV